MSKRSTNDGFVNVAEAPDPKPIMPWEKSPEEIAYDAEERKLRMELLRSDAENMQARIDFLLAGTRWHDEHYRSDASCLRIFIAAALESGKDGTAAVTAANEAVIELRRVEGR